MTTVVFSTQAYYSPAPLFRVVGGAVVFSSRPVSGQECLGFGGAVSRVEYVSGATVPGAAQALGLRGHAAVPGAEGVSDVRRAERAGREQLIQLVLDAQREVLLAQVQGEDDATSSFTGTTSDTGSDNGTNGTKPMNPWGYRTSSPPG